MTTRDKAVVITAATLIIFILSALVASVGMIWSDSRIWGKLLGTSIIFIILEIIVIKVFEDELLNK